MEIHFINHFMGDDDDNTATTTEVVLELMMTLRADDVVISRRAFLQEGKMRLIKGRVVDVMVSRDA